jgi:hypothetical protein
MNVNLPNWNMERLIRKAVACWNLQHDAADPETSPWPEIYNSVLAFLRHWQSQYDEALAAGADRNALHQSLKDAARLQYPWLRLGTDPRTAKAEPVAEKPLYAQRSKDLSKLVSEKDRLIRAKAELRKTYHPDYKEQLAAINSEIQTMDNLVANLMDSFKINKGDLRRKWITDRDTYPQFS